jgi:hypothetical protein
MSGKRSTVNERFFSKRYFIIAAVYFILSSSFFGFSWLISILTIDGSALFWDVLIFVGKVLVYPMLYLITPLIYSNAQKINLIIIFIVSFIINSFFWAAVIEIIRRLLMKKK